MVNVEKSKTMKNEFPLSELTLEERVHVRVVEARKFILEHNLPLTLHYEQVIHSQRQNEVVMLEPQNYTIFPWLHIIREKDNMIIDEIKQMYKDEL